MAVETDSDARPHTAQSLEPERVAALQGEGDVQLIDVRQPEEWSEGRLAGARRIALADLPAHAGEIDRERPVVFYCRGGNRSAMAADAFRTDGYDAYNMSGGFAAWEEAGLPLERDDGGAGTAEG